MNLARITGSSPSTSSACSNPAAILLHASRTLLSFPAQVNVRATLRPCTDRRVSRGYGPPSGMSGCGGIRGRILHVECRKARHTRGRGVTGQSPSSRPFRPGTTLRKSSAKHPRTKPLPAQHAPRDPLLQHRPRPSRIMRPPVVRATKPMPGLIEHLELAAGRRRGVASPVAAGIPLPEPRPGLTPPRTPRHRMTLVVAHLRAL